MCETCGCSVDHTHDHDHEHGHDHQHSHQTVDLDRTSLLSFNNKLAAGNRETFAKTGCVVMNIVSSPGSGKTMLLERTLRALESKLRMAVIVGDLATENDADRLNATKAKAIQITTGTACHLDAHMIHHAIEKLDLENIDLLLIENVGNLVCPASFDLGEDVFVVLHATTEGEDKPLKYPVIFQKADAVVINKVDLTEAVEFDEKAALDNIRKAAPKATRLAVSAKSGESMMSWYAYVLSRVARKRGVPA